MKIFVGLAAAAAVALLSVEGASATPLGTGAALSADQPLTTYVQRFGDDFGRRGDIRRGEPYGRPGRGYGPGGRWGRGGWRHRGGWGPPGRRCVRNPWGRVVCYR